MAATFIDNSKIQEALVAYLKSKTTLTSVITAKEIRENTWKGTDFKYPNVRVDLVNNKPGKLGCPQDIDVTFQVFSESPSSKQADEIAGIITVILHDKPFQQSTLNFSLVATNVKPAYEVGVNTWRSDVVMSGQVS